MPKGKAGKAVDWLWKVTRGFPMIEIERCRFVDKVVWRPVGLYRDRLGREFLAYHKWDLGRGEREKGKK